MRLGNDEGHGKPQEKPVSRSKHTYLVYAKRNTSQFGQKLQEIRCRVLDARVNYILVESLKRYARKYAGASRTASGIYAGLPVRRVNRDQILMIVDERTGKEVKWETIRRREGSQRTPGRARGGR
jgi:hypothetical protein